ncbi:MAG: Rpn family recombination-promoting nuclease/putative transposase [Oscillospiraceae bacterium]|nr:Rpn family recombination-promoting nuclease/putative transposase [Oscillospiraceae bacterium]
MKNDKDMTKKDHLTKTYIGQDEIFADAVNYAVYNGEKIILPEVLEDGSTVATSFIYKGDDFRLTFERTRDVRKVIRKNPKDQTCYMVFGAENQSQLHYAMPVKAMTYDVLEYICQIENRKKTFEAISEAKKVGEEPLEAPPDNAEFLSSWKSDDKLVPVVTIVINFGEKRWDAPVTLHEMFDKTKRKFQRNKIIREMIPDYKFILIDPHQMSEDDFERMNTNLGNVLRIINYAGDKDKLIKFAESGAKFNQLETQLINKFTGVDMEVPEENEVKKMSEGFRQIIAESEAKGENKLSALIRALEEAGRKDDAFKAASDAEYRRKLYAEFGIE